MPTIDFTDEELQGLILICAQGSGPGISWMMTNAILTKAQAAAQQKQGAAQQAAIAGLAAGDGLDHEPIAQPPAYPSARGGKR